MAETEPQYIIDAAGNARQITDPNAVQRAADQGEQFISQQGAIDRVAQERQQAEMEGRYSPAEQFGIGAVSGLTLGLGPSAAAWGADKLMPGGPSARSDLQGMQGTGSFLAGDVAGMLAPMVFSGGESLGARSAIGKALGSTPAGLLGSVGGAADRLALNALPEASSALGRVGRGILSTAARGASEGAILGLTQQISQGIISDAPLTAESMLSSSVDGALMGGLLGGGLGGIGKGIGELGQMAGGKIAKGIGPSMTLGRIGADASDVARMESEGGVRQALKDFHDEVMTPGGVSYKSSTGKINQVAREAEVSYQKVQKDIIDTLGKEAPASVPELARVQSRFAQEAVMPYVGTMAQKDVQRAVQRIESRLLDIGESGVPRGVGNHAGTKGMGSWESWLDARNQINSIGKLVRDKGVSADLKSRLLGIMDSEINDAMEAAGGQIERPGLPKQFQSAAAGERTAKHLAEMTGRKGIAEAMGGSSMIDQGDVKTLGWGLLTGHPLAGAAVVAGKGLAGKLQNAVTPYIAQRAYEMSVGARAAGSVVNTKSRVKEAVATFFQGGRRAAPEVGLKSRDQYEKTLDRTSQLISPMQQDKVKQYAQTLASMGQPALADNVLQTNQRAVDYLRHNMPPSTKANSSTSLMFQPTKHGLSQDEWKFFRIDKAIKSPLSLLDNIEDGTVTREEVKAVQYVYPDLYSNIVQTVTEGVYNLKQDGNFLPMDKVTQLGIVLDAPIDPMLDPSFVADIQAALEVPEQPGPKPQRNDQIDPMNLQTPAEQMSGQLS